jgi:hypothetical protein
VIGDRPVRRVENLDVAGTSQDQENGLVKGRKGKSAARPHLCSLCAPAARRSRGQRQPRYRLGGTRLISIPQADNIIEAVSFAKSVGLPLVAHLTIYWSLTNAGDDPDGKLLAKFREGLSKWLYRRRIEFASAWARENPGGDVEHCHLLFHLPEDWCTGAKKLQLEAELYRLIKHHAGDYSHEGVIKLAIWPNPDGKYLLKGGGPKVWQLFRLRNEHRRRQGVIHGKRCGVSQNLGQAARCEAL